MNDRYAGEVRDGLESFDEYLEAGWDYRQVNSFSGGILVPAGVWTVTVFVAAVLVWLGQSIAGVMVAGIVAVIHIGINPRVGAYILLLAVPVEWMVGVIPQVATVTKLIGVWVLVVSIPRLLRAVGSGRWDPVVKWVVLLLLWAGISGFWAPYKLMWILRWQTLILTWGMVMLICLHLNSRASLRTGMLFLLVGCLISWIAFMKVGDLYRTARLVAERGEFLSLVGAEVRGDPNLASRHYALGIFVSIFLIIVSREIVKKSLFVPIILVLSIGIILTKGRAVYLGAPAALVGSVLLLKGGGISKRVILMIVIAVLGGITVFAAGGLGMLGVGVQARFASIFEEGFRAGGRLNYWKIYLREFFSSGGFGRGLNQVRWTVGQVAHNDWIEIMGDLGVIGLVAFFGLHLCLFRRIRMVGYIWSKMLCLMLWLFMIVVGLAQTDYCNKWYGLAIGLILVSLRLDEAERLQAEEYLLSGADGAAADEYYACET